MKVGSWTIKFYVDRRQWIFGGYFNRRCGWFHVYVALSQSKSMLTMPYRFNFTHDLLNGGMNMAGSATERRYAVGEIVPEGYEYDNRGLKYGDTVTLNEDVLIKLEPFFENIIIPKGAKGTIKGLDIESGSFFNQVGDKHMPVWYRGHKVYFDVFSQYECLHENFCAEIEPYKLDKVSNVIDLAEKMKSLQ